MLWYTKLKDKVRHENQLPSSRVYPIGAIFILLSSAQPISPVVLIVEQLPDLKRRSPVSPISGWDVWDGISKVDHVLGVETELILVGPSRGDLQYRRRNLPKPMMS